MFKPILGVGLSNISHRYCGAFPNMYEWIFSFCCTRIGSSKSDIIPQDPRTRPKMSKKNRKATFRESFEVAPGSCVRTFGVELEESARAFAYE